MRWAVAKYKHPPPRAGFLLMLVCGAGELSQTGLVLDSWGEEIWGVLHPLSRRVRISSVLSALGPSERQD